MSNSLTGGCLCGAVRFQAAGAPRFGIRCYCRDCQHVSGGGHLPQVAVTRNEVTIDGPLKVHASTSDAGFAIEIAFCRDCGSPIYKSTARAEDIMFIAAGAFDDPTAVPDLRPVFEDGRLPWDSA